MGDPPGFVLPIGARRGQRQARILTGPDPYAMAFGPGGRTLYVATAPVRTDGEHDTALPGSVVPVSLATARPGRRVKVGKGALAMIVA